MKKNTIRMLIDVPAEGLSRGDLVEGDPHDEDPAVKVPLNSFVYLADLERMARATHEMNRQYCDLIGDPSQVPWTQAPEWQRESAMEGVFAVLAGIATSPEEQHAEWMKIKVAEGWVYGKIKDPEKKTHPCMVPYDELPEWQQAKDEIFRATARGVAARWGYLLR